MFTLIHALNNVKHRLAAKEQRCGVRGARGMDCRDFGNPFYCRHENLPISKQRGAGNSVYTGSRHVAVGISTNIPGRVDREFEATEMTAGDSKKRPDGARLKHQGNRGWSSRVRSSRQGIQVFCDKKRLVRGVLFQGSENGLDAK
jgi:hypothetical protein